MGRKSATPETLAADARRESKRVEFKADFDPTSAQAWCEAIKDIIAIANSGGGVILFGVGNDGRPSGVDVSGVLSLDPAVLTDKIARYTGEQFGDFEILEATRQKERIAVLQIGAATIPLVFGAPGTYDAGGGKQKTAFSQGGVYFRHGAKSEPGTTKDLREAIDREIDRIRRSWMGSIRKVVTAPRGHRVEVLPAEVRLDGSTTAMPVRLVSDASAPALRAVGTDELYPHRLKEVRARVNEALPELNITAHDLYCIRRVHGIEGETTFFCKPRFGSPQYSDAFVDWIVEQYRRDESFFQRARDAMRNA